LESVWYHYKQMTGRPDLLLTQIDTNTRTTRAMPNSAWELVRRLSGTNRIPRRTGGIFPLSILTFAPLSGGEPCWLVQDSVASPPPTQRAAQEVAAYHILAILEVRGWQTQAEVENRQLCQFFASLLPLSRSSLISSPTPPHLSMLRLVGVSGRGR